MILSVNTSVTLHYQPISPFIKIPNFKVIKVIAITIQSIVTIINTLIMKSTEVKHEDRLELIKQYAYNCHKDTNHLYDGKPYSYHLNMVVNYAIKFSVCLTSKYKENFDKEKTDILQLVIAGCYVHDVIEDTRQTYNDVRTVTNKIIADIAYALTNEKGKNRAERANDKYYDEIRINPLATYVKICDRLANIKHSKDTNSSMLSKYRKENIEFKNKLDIYPEFKPMFDEIDDLLIDTK